MFVLCMRQDYIDKRKAFRQIIDVHKTELDEKERYWNEMLTVDIHKLKFLKNHTCCFKHFEYSMGRVQPMCTV